ncbi:hypothetical protein A4H97_22350 [Niastella yeongjuensis]|uniref:Sulfatase N-terminal domain-containing protein n=1 Tax=Niastella yeongjuensis TaxID=354355 RepID=A0A1V9F7J5_9BACT|nr:sulfatase-like hydrolase/transferase [Niastella yeongjuensis]OQP54241.1 hypothetical protein A4H97_22350 [Niastella yeongjuensis]SEP31455.1 Phosphoethanolamine transferase for glucans (OPG), alkaline phosphatase superfamily [Niastella yeongjuensis]
MHFVRPFKKLPLHSVLIIIFFLTHGYSEYIGLIPFGDMLYYFAIQLLVASLFFLLFLGLLRSAGKAGILTTLVLLFSLFYGAIADSLKVLPFLGVLSHYRYLFSIFIIGIIILFIYLKRSPGTFQRATVYLNCVFTFLIIYDIGFILLQGSSAAHVASNGTGINDKHGEQRKRPDIYFLIMDEYSGSGTLRRYFNYDNSAFEHNFKQQGFYVAASPQCNYTMTVYSIASTLSMDYLGWLPKGQESAADNARANKVISDNKVVGFLKQNGYEIHNYSIFDIGEQPSQFDPGLFSFRLKLITSKTLLSRMDKDMSWILRVYLGHTFSWVEDDLRQRFRDGNERIINLTKSAASTTSGRPKFVYAHLMMPHKPFLYDSLGRGMSMDMDTTSNSNAENNAYLQYLVYSNKVVTGLVNELLKKTKGEAVIIVMSDHGYRSLFVNGKSIEPVNNFNAVYLPEHDYSRFYESISNVNQFRVVFNSLFKSDLPLLPDSCTCD